VANKPITTLSDDVVYANLVQRAGRIKSRGTCTDISPS